MDESFIKQAFTTMGEIVVYVKIMRNRYTGCVINNHFNRLSIILYLH